MKRITFKQAFSCISIGVILAILFCVVLSSCSTVKIRPVTKDLHKVQKQRQNRYEMSQHTPYNYKLDKATNL